ncbi:glycosyl hydrolase catalytic core-domain-containing protein [Crucibulum laeve]|uniref:Glycosyl hydrolase catalytic core-domain-containing protein n=1 Tax=Crucibulum laeve TaxID=68775 RepID=A0A5C3MG08_9AGAR|nr:glycosyl hydrolase catalytic core-domain-containing protein [Crucibulum laeve]
MAVAKLLNLFAVSSLAILACSFGSTPVNALSIESNHHLARHAARGHGVIAAKKKRASTSKRCKPRPSSSVVVATPPKTTSAASASAPASTPKTTAPAPATTSKAASSGNSGSNTGGNTNTNPGAKVGLAWPNGDDSSLRNFKTNKVSRIYSWSPWKPALSDSLGLEFIPMLWGEKQIADFQRLVKPGTAKTVLGFNEPNQDGQSDMSPQRAAQVWQQNIQPLKNSGMALISPATTSAPSGKTWMKDFFAACNGCSFDGLALHWYGTDAQEFIKYVTDFHTTFNLPIWVTEFACQNFSGGAQCTKDQVFSFMDTVTNFMDNSPFVAAYFAFGVMHDMVGVNTLDQLMGPNGLPTDLGYSYIN